MECQEDDRITAFDRSHFVEGFDDKQVTTIALPNPTYLCRYPGSLQVASHLYAYARLG